MAPSQYKDIAKAANDLLSNDYCFDRKLKITTVAANGVKLTTEGVLGGKGVKGKLNAKFKPFDNISFEKCTVDTTGRFIGEAKLSKAFRGADFTVKAQDGANKDPAGELLMEYSTDSMTMDLSVDVVKGPTVAGAGTFAKGNFTLGGEFRYNTQFDGEGDASLEDYGFGLAYTNSDLTASLKTAKKISAIDFATHHAVSSDVQVATAVNYSMKSGAPVMSVGGMYKVDADSKLQGKVDSKGVVSANFHQVLNPKVKLIASAQVDAVNLTSDSHKFGLSLLLG